MKDSLKLWWADPGLVQQYCPDLLQAADRKRAETTRSPHAEQDWRVSRALLQQARAAWPVGAGEPAISISHTRGHALIGTAPGSWRIGVDVETIRDRDVASLAKWCCSDDERAALARCDGQARRLRAFYLLWTLKEAFVKAANLDFPADMRSVGLTPADGCTGSPHDFAGWRLRTPPGCWRAYAAVLGDTWMAGLVWRAVVKEGPGEPSRDDGPGGVPCWPDVRGVVLPRIVPVGQWR